MFFCVFLLTCLVSFGSFLNAKTLGQLNGKSTDSNHFDLVNQLCTMIGFLQQQLTIINHVTLDSVKPPCFTFISFLLNFLEARKLLKSSLIHC